MDPVLTKLAEALATQGPLFAVLVTIIVTVTTATWVPGFLWKQTKNERDQALERTDRLVGVIGEMSKRLERIDDTLERIDDKLLRAIDRQPGGRR
jgi:hypothetical protein